MTTLAALPSFTIIGPLRTRQLSLWPTAETLNDPASCFHTLAEGDLLLSAITGEILEVRRPKGSDAPYYIGVARGVDGKETIAHISGKTVTLHLYMKKAP